MISIRNGLFLLIVILSGLVVGIAADYFATHCFTKYALIAFAVNCSRRLH